jgi:eukaryotic-like serine/threonine-protein kinase
MRICPKCRRSFSGKGRATCPNDGARLADARELAEADNDPLIGQTIAGRYEIIERLGTGGMGTVYRAKQASLGRPVALKILKKELNWETDTVTRFHREARAMSLLVHANTVRVFDFGMFDVGPDGARTDGLLYFAMELLDGELLTANIEREGALAVGEAIRVARQILGSLHEAHSHGIVHRDLKPDNIMLARVEGHGAAVVKVLDFGIAKVLRNDRKIDELETQAGTVFGTPRYMSPEQAQGHPLDARSDLYSVGVLLYHMLTGRPPFTDDDAVVVMAKHIRERPDSPRDAAPDRPIPRSLEKVVLRAIEKDRDRRFSSAASFAEALSATLPDVDREAVERTSMKPTVPKLPLALAGLVVLLAVCASTYLIVTSGAADAETTRAVVRHDTPPAPSEPESADLRVDSTPSGASVVWSGQELGVTPFTVRRPQGSVLEVEVRLHGYETARLEVRAGEARSVELVRLPVAAEPPPEPEQTVAVRADPPRRGRNGRAGRNPATADRGGEAAMASMSEEPYERW